MECSIHPGISGRRRTKVAQLCEYTILYEKVIYRRKGREGRLLQGLFLKRGKVELFQPDSDFLHPLVEVFD